MDQFPYKQTWRPVSLGTAKVFRNTRVVGRVNQRLVIDPFQIAIVDWPGASYIAANLSIDPTLTQSFAFRLPIQKPFDYSFCPAVSWLVDGVRIRYKLWADVDENFEAPTYAGESIPVGAILELWTVGNSPGLGLYLPDPWKPAISLLDIPTKPETTDGTLYATTICSIFLTNYPPANLSQYFETCNPNV